MIKTNIYALILMLLTLICYSGSYVYSQGAAINTSGAAADPSAILDASSSTQGVLFPRMTTNERNAISSPAQSLIIFNTTTLCLEIYINGLWQSMYCNCNPPSAPTAGVNVPSKTQIVWNWNSVSGATGYKYNTVNDYASATDAGNNTTYTQSGLTCETGYTLYVWSYSLCGSSASYLTLPETTSSCWSCGDNLVVAHTAGSVAPVNKTVTYGTVSTGISGATKCWITQNLGATNQANSPTDASEDAGGWFWQFNRMQGYKHDGSTRTPSSWNITSINENSNWLQANDPCTLLLGSTWRIPTYAEWYNADASGPWTNYNQTYASVLKIHPAGLLYPNDGSLYGRGAGGYYFTSSQIDNTTAYHLGFTSGDSEVRSVGKAYGMPLRCIKD